jgi:HEAT repeat protein
MTHDTQVTQDQIPFTSLPLALIVEPNPQLYGLLANLCNETAWGERKIAAQKLGNLRDTDALPGLLDRLVVDGFWMVRCAIIQALEKIGDPAAIPTLKQVSVNDSFQVVRSHALKAIERLSR